ncbi:MAG: hypothetical protein IKP28_04260 [Clostridia bacterium]|nr:hypothetical protein [Clostridia bacterium]
MNILKRNQVVIFVIALMLVTAGYLNFMQNSSELIETSGEIIEDTTFIGKRNNR